MKKILLNIIYLFSKSSLISLIAKKIIDYKRNENNCEITTNGELDFILKNKDNFNIIFDVGANVGEWTELINKYTDNKAKIYSFEPSKQTYKTLSSNKFGDNIILKNIGLGENNETKEFYIFGDDSTLNSAFDRGIEMNHTKEQADFEKLDDFCKKNNIDHISFLKIDTEGNELSVLKGAEEFIKNGKIDFIQFEYGGTYIDAGFMLKDVFNFFKNTPYKIYKMKKHGLQEIDSYNHDLESFQYSNYIAKLIKND